jgi:hypothetical protein
MALGILSKRSLFEVHDGLKAPQQPLVNWITWAASRNYASRAQWLAAADFNPTCRSKSARVSCRVLSSGLASI